MPTPIKLKQGTNYYQPLCYFPIGYIYLSTSNVNPGQFFGGTWEPIKDRFLLLAGDTYKGGKTGGEAEHTLTKNELPNTTLQIIDPTYSWTVYIAGYNSGSANEYPGLTGLRRTPSSSQRLRTEALGNSQPHNNMPPYIVVYGWVKVSN
jgi:hypothetical protein